MVISPSYISRFLESAGSYIKMINETKDLRSALLLEQVWSIFSFINQLIRLNIQILI